jgi:crotonobetainyl-CoA:carnitine CoA-transferase CaiB-like acyl-CoA transferase
MQSNRSNPQLLAGVRVVEFCAVAAGPFCGMLLADLGAEVTKIEPPEGDALRQWPPLTAGYSENFAALNRNKRSVVLNLKDPADLACARQLIAASAVLIENNRPGVMARLGLDYATLKVAHPTLVYCSISAFGQSGPRRAEGGFDLTIQAAAGIMSVTGTPEGEPVKCGVPVSDFASGLYAAFAIAAALARVRAGGPGANLDVPMLGCTLGIAALQTSEYFGTGRSPRRLGSAHPRNAPYQRYEAADGDFVIAAGNQKLWAAVCAVVGLPELERDPRFSTTTDRARNQALLKDLLEARFRLAPVADWIADFNAQGVPHARINDFAAALADPQVEAMGWVTPLTLPNGARTRTFGSPLRVDGLAPPIYRAPPGLGEHTEEIKTALAQTGAEGS